MNNSAIASNTFVFNELEFQKYYELYYRPHDKTSGWKFMWLFLILWAIALGIAIIAFSEWLNGSRVSFWNENGILLSILVVFLSCCVVYGFTLWRGLRHPYWGSKRWNARTNAAFRMLSEGVSQSPFPPYSRGTISPIYLLMPYAWINSSIFDCPMFYDVIPGLIPSTSKLDPRSSEGKPLYEVPFQARFYDDHVEKGNPLHECSYLYTDIYDIVEDKRFPNLAIIRMKDAASEVVVRKDCFKGASWDDVKERIAEVNEWITLREALFGKRKRKSN